MAVKTHWRRVGEVNLNDGLGLIDYTNSLYVSSFCGKTLAEGATGTKDNPFNTLTEAQDYVETFGVRAHLIINGYFNEEFKNNSNINNIYGDGYAEVESIDYEYYNTEFRTSLNYIKINKFLNASKWLYIPFEIKYCQVEPITSIIGNFKFYNCLVNLNDTLTVNLIIDYCKNTTLLSDINNISTNYIKFKNSNYTSSYINSIFRCYIDWSDGLTYFFFDSCIFQNCAIKLFTTYETYDNTTVGADQLVNDLYAIRKRFSDYYYSPDVFLTNCLIFNNSDIIFHDIDTQNFGIPLNGYAHSVSNDLTFCGAYTPSYTLPNSELFDIDTTNNMQIDAELLQPIDDNALGDIETIEIDFTEVKTNIVPRFDCIADALNGKNFDANLDYNDTPIASGEDVLTIDKFYLVGSLDIVNLTSNIPIVDGYILENNLYWCIGDITYNGDNYTDEWFLGVADVVNFTGTGNVYSAKFIDANTFFKCENTSFFDKLLSSADVYEVYEFPNRLALYFWKLDALGGNIVNEGYIEFNKPISIDGSGKGNADKDFDKSTEVLISGRYFKFKVYYRNNLIKKWILA